MAEWELKIGQKWISNCWCRCLLLPACPPFKYSRTALLAQVESPRLFPACEPVHPCELPVPCPVPLPPGAPGPCTGTYRQGVMEHAFRDGLTPVIGSAFRGLAKAQLLDIAQGHASPSRLFHTSGAASG